MQISWVLEISTVFLNETDFNLNLRRRYKTQGGYEIAHFVGVTICCILRGSRVKRLKSVSFKKPVEISSTYEICPEARIYPVAYQNKTDLKPPQFEWLFNMFEIIFEKSVSRKAIFNRE